LSFPILNYDRVAVATVTMPFLSSYVQPVPFAKAASMLFEAAKTITGMMGGVMPAAQLPR
jgi:hypothetical protein